MCKINIQCAPNDFKCAAELKHAIRVLFDDVFWEGTHETEYDIVLQVAGYGCSFGDLKEQLFEICSDGKRLYITAKSEAALFWGVCELKERWGVVHMLSEDIYPRKKQSFYLPVMNEIFTPKVQIREWRILCGFLMGGEGRSLAEQKRLIKQLAKLKNNSIKLDLWPQSPFLSYSCVHQETGEVLEKKGGDLHFGYKIPVKEGSISSCLTKATSFYTNPDFAGCKTDEELSERAEYYLSDIIKTAKECGMRVVVNIFPFDYPKAFAPMLEEAKKVQQLGELVCEGGEVLGEKSLRMIKLLVDTVLKKYPDLDVLGMTFPEISRTVEGFQEAMDYLDGRFGIRKKYDMDAWLSYRDEMVFDDVERAELEGEMTIQLIAVLYRILEKSGLEKAILDRGKKIAIAVGAMSTHLLPVYKDILAQGYELYEGMYTCDRMSRVLHTLDKEDFSDKPVLLVMTLQDDNVGGIMQMQMESFSRVFAFHVKHGMKGYSTRFWPQGDLEEAAHAISVASWSDKTVMDALRETYQQVYGLAAGRAAEAMEELERLTTIINVTDDSLTFPIGRRIRGYLGPNYCTDRKGIAHAFVGYLEVESLLKNAMETENISEYAQKRLRYLMGRAAFSGGLLKSLYLFLTGNKKLVKQSMEKAFEDYEKALEAAKGALQEMANVAEYDNDVALVVIYEYLFIQEVQEKMQDILQKK